jgi:hypothetical protein
LLRGESSGSCEMKKGRESAMSAKRFYGIHYFTATNEGWAV